MPTAYTDPVGTGEITDLKGFALLCARGMGACLSMRDEPLSTPIPEKFEPSPYYRDALAEAQEKLAEVQSWTEAESQEAACSAYKEGIERVQRENNETALALDRYRDMLAQVTAWHPPTEDHKQFRFFMIDQLNDTIDFECRVHLPEPVLQTGEQYRQARIADLLRRITQYAQNWCDENERAASRTAWVKALRESFDANG